MPNWLPFSVGLFISRDFLLGPMDLFMAQTDAMYLVIFSSSADVGSYDGGGVIQITTKEEPEIWIIL